MITILEVVRKDQIRGNVRKPQYSLGIVPQYAKKVTKDTLPKESSEKIKIQASLSRGKIPRPRKFSSWGSKRFTTTTK
jgi:hypothetical protein